VSRREVLPLSKVSFPLHYDSAGHLSYIVSRMFKKDNSPSLFNLPPLLAKERGIKGVRLIN